MFIYIFSKILRNENSLLNWCLNRCALRRLYSLTSVITVRLPIPNGVVFASSAPRRFLTVQNFRFGGGYRNYSRVMEDDAESRSTEAEANSGEDFVHVEKSAMESLSDSIVNVEVPSEVEEEDDYDDVASTSATGAAATVTSAEEEELDSERRKILPEELSRSVVVLTCDSTAESGVCDVHIVGTAHVSVESCREVEAVISYLKPEVVFLELCPSRVAVLSPQNFKVPTTGEMIDMWKKKHNAFGILYSWFLAKVASQLEVLPGAEFRVAYEEAMKYGGKVVLGDRPVQLKEMDDVDMLTLVIQEMSKEFPTMMETLVHERDQYMSSTLLRIAKEHNSVVAVVGKGHLRGINKHWKQPVVVNDLMEIPSEKKRFTTVRVLKSVAVAVAGAAIISGIYAASKK